MGNQCAFRCHNVPGSFRCFCPYGYALAPDGRHCEGACIHTLEKQNRRFRSPAPCSRGQVMPVLNSFETYTKMRFKVSRSFWDGSKEYYHQKFQNWYYFISVSGARASEVVISVTVQFTFMSLCFLFLFPL